METTRSSQVQSGIRIEVLTIAWMVVEMAVSVGAGIASRSVLLVAFGLDSLIELASGGILLWRLRVESRGGKLEEVEKAEKRAARGVAVALAMLCIYVLVSAVIALVARSKPTSSPVGIGIALAALLLMPALAIGKRRISKRIGSEALAVDAVNSITCAYMAGTVLLGLALNTFLGWWWAEPVAALIFLVWLGKETWEAFEEAR
jgi:divalent metal cation (Fe/Co/Zn/Cd) transporter